MSKEQENKTGTNTSEMTCERSVPVAPDLEIERVWREVVDFGDPVSGTGEDGWGRKRVSVARVSILDAPVASKCENKKDAMKQGKNKENHKEKGNRACVK